jgi:hypothetical protein
MLLPNEVRPPGGQPRGAVDEAPSGGLSAPSLSIIHRPADAHPIQLKPENFDNVAGKWVTNDLLLRSALWYASIGRPVFPCYPWEGDKAKSPLTTNGFHDATIEIDQIVKWWAQHPFAMIGGPVPLNEVCLDVDPRSGGDIWALIELVSMPTGSLPPTCTVISGRLDGGQHQFFKRPQGTYESIRLPSGIDLKDGGKGYTILPPSVHPDSGGVYFYRARTMFERAMLPEPIYQLLLKVPRTSSVRRPEFAAQPVVDRPATKALAGLLRKVGETGEGNRQSIGFWAAGKLLERGYGLNAWDALEEVLASTGASKHDLETALRERPGGMKVHA